MRKIALFGLLFVIPLVGCSKHEHTYSTKYSYDETSHWLNATCEHKTEYKEKYNHTLDTLGNCMICGYVKGISEELKKIDDSGMYSITLRDDYFEDYLQAGGGSSDQDVYDFALANISDDEILKRKLNNALQGACSSFNTLNSDGDYILGRNLDFQPNFNSLIMRNIPKNGYESLSFTSLINIKFTNDDDPFQHQQALKVAEFVPLDGINSAGLALNMNDLYNSDSYAKQNTGKIPLTTTCLIRLLLNKAATVDEAINLIKQYDINDSDTRTAHYHIMLADKSGSSAIIEFYKNELQIIRKNSDDKIFAMTNTEINQHFPESTKEKSGWKDCSRYQAIMNKYTEYDKNVTKEEAMEILKVATQNNTLHSIVYNLEKQSVYFSRKKNWDTKYYFGLNQSKIYTD